MINTLIWFKNDLRIHDNLLLLQAKKNGGNCVGIYVLDSKELESAKPHLWDFPRMGTNRARFLYEALTSLKEGMKELGSDLLVQIGKPEDLIPKLAQKIQAEEILASQEICPEELVTLATVISNLPTRTHLKITRPTSSFLQ